MNETLLMPRTVGEAVDFAAKRLTAGGVSNGFGEGKELVARALGADRKSMDFRRQEGWPASSQPCLDSLLGKRTEGVPLAYLLGEWDFLDMTLTVTPDVLIPRPETEELFQWMTDDVGTSTVAEVADVGTGAGGIALAAARRWPSARVTAVDLSPAALAVARWNARRHGVEGQIRFRRSDLLEGTADRSLEVVVANLPYVRTGELADLSPEVRNEPRGALDGGSDGLNAIRRLIPQAHRALREGGRLFLEVGRGQPAAVAAALKEAGFAEISVAGDAAGIERFLRGIR